MNLPVHRRSLVSRLLSTPAAVRPAQVRNSSKALRAWGAAILLLTLVQIPAHADSAARTISVNGSFENGLAAWTVKGDVHLDTAHPLAGKASVRIGPGAGSIEQRIAVGSDNHLLFSALLHASPAGAGKLTLRFFSKSGRELMQIDSGADMQPGKEPGSIEDYLRPHPLTASVEIEVSKDATPGYVEAGNITLGVYDENDPSLKSTEDLAAAMKPIWQGTLVTNEAVLLQEMDGKPAMGTLMFQPTRILSVTDYSGEKHYAEGEDFSVQGRTLLGAPQSKMPQVNDAQLLKGDLAWNEIGGKQVLVTYEHSGAWSGPVQPYVGDQLPTTLGKLRTHGPLRIVAYGDSITFGIGSSRMRKILPYQPPWIEMFARQLALDWQDSQIALLNSSQSGADSRWAKAMASRMVASLHPDLVVIAFGQNDFWRVSADEFQKNIAAVIAAVRAQNPRAEFLLVSTMRFDPAYTVNRAYWDLVSQYETKLRAMTGPGVQLVDFTTISGAIYAAKEPKDCMNDPLHPDDYLSRWYAQSLIAALVPPRH